jgi:hypothetical protein
MHNRELTLTDLLADPMTLAVMAADRVDPASLEAVLSSLRLVLVNDHLPTRHDKAGG